MTPTELMLPWRAFEDLAPWSATVRCGMHEVTLRPWREPVRLYERGDFVGETKIDRHELLDLCAAFELGRVTYADGDRLVLAKVARRRKAWTWALLVDGAPGLRREDAPGGVSIGHVLDRLGFELVEVSVDRRRESDGVPGAAVRGVTGDGDCGVIRG